MPNTARRFAIPVVVELTSLNHVSPSDVALRSAASRRNAHVAPRVSSDQVGDSQGGGALVVHAVAHRSVATTAAVAAAARTASDDRLGIGSG